MNEPMPPLPDPAIFDPGRFGLAWNAEQLVAYGQQCAAAQRERADKLQALCNEWAQKATTWINSPEAEARLQGYQALIARAHAAEAREANLREALQEIERRTQGTSYRACQDIFDLARAALAAKD